MNTSSPGVAATDAGFILPNWDPLGAMSNTCNSPSRVEFREHEQSLRTHVEEDLPLSVRIFVHDQGNFPSLPVRGQPTHPYRCPLHPILFLRDHYHLRRR
ncbi:hypothetical protein BLNAU_24784 [Blattamonas nauphoetae]|uniref:Uncharacterized protein n=1 Tax=Blattamonas nauphoetae TaxID=2049346 RepID=A0ABQ9WLG6_9EUKA|nr:hypothetical protein BLNAU_24784 [Blattamonas nauphoetae]